MLSRLSRVSFLFGCAAVVAGLASSVAAAVPPTEPMQWRSGLTEINEGWATHGGDDSRWAQPGFDDSRWERVDIEDIGPAQTGWRWFRRDVNVGPEPIHMRLLVSGGDGTYELYVNGARVEGTRIRSTFAVARPAERVFSLNVDSGEFLIAVRTHAPPIYGAYSLPLFLSVTLGQPTAIEYERAALESERMYTLLPSMAINLLLCAAGLGVLGLFQSQRSQREYLYLGLYLLAIGASNALWIPEQTGVLPISILHWIADPLLYVFTILQIEFTFGFIRMRPSRRWRVYEILLLCPIGLIPFTWLGLFWYPAYILVECVLILPAAVLLPAVLLVWYRRGNREAGWLILPSLLPAATQALFEFGGTSIALGWHRLDFLANPVQAGVAQVQISDLGNLVFLFAIGFVMFFRFTRVSREQARSAAELEAAREIQRRLVPAALPEVAGYRLEAAYLPAQEVGGDFYQVMKQGDGSTLVVVGDVSGKGLKAAMTGTLAIGALRTLAGEGLRPAALLERLNEEIVRAEDGGFITCVCARMSRDGGVVLANAGHLAPYLSGAEVECDFGFPLGIAAGAEYGETGLRLAAGEMLTFMSDGVVEARTGTGELFGFERTRAISGGTAAEIAEAARAFGQEDDITVLTVAMGA